MPRCCGLVDDVVGLRPVERRSRDGCTAFQRSVLRLIPTSWAARQRAWSDAAVLHVPGQVVVGAEQQRRPRGAARQRRRRQRQYHRGTRAPATSAASPSPPSPGRLDQTETNRPEEHPPQRRHPRTRARADHRPRPRGEPRRELGGPRTRDVRALLRFRRSSSRRGDTKARSTPFHLRGPAVPCATSASALAASSRRSPEGASGRCSASTAAARCDTGGGPCAAVLPLEPRPCPTRVARMSFDMPAEWTR